MPPSVEATTRDAAAGAIDQQREIQFARDVAAGLDIDPMHGPPGRAGLLGDQRMADHRFGRRAHLVGRARQAHTALAVRIIGEAAGAAATGMDLRLHHIDRAGKLARRRHRLVRRPRDVAVGHRDAVALQQFLGLVFVDVHRPGSADELLRRLDQFPDRGAGFVERGLLVGVQLDLHDPLHPAGANHHRTPT